jgi:hypothetical protein
MLTCFSIRSAISCFINSAVRTLSSLTAEILNDCSYFSFNRICFISSSALLCSSFSISSSSRRSRTRLYASLGSWILTPEISIAEFVRSKAAIEVFYLLLEELGMLACDLLVICWEYSCSTLSRKFINSSYFCFTWLSLLMDEGAGCLLSD